MFAEARGDYLLDSTLAGASVTMATASLDADNNVVVKTAAYSDNATTLDIALDGFAGVGSSAKVKTLSSAAGKSASNSLDHPTAITPVISTVSISKGKTLSVIIPAWSIIVVTIPCHDLMVAGMGTQGTP
jgi:alpha-L-arabinofuranosidase